MISFQYLALWSYFRYVDAAHTGIGMKEPTLKFSNKTKRGNGFYIEFRQNFAKETFSYNEHLKS